jgi:predicted enzyme related to lactoylglutathione lyase
MGRVTGIGGVFFKAESPEKLYEWYAKHLGIKQDVPGQGVSFRWKEDGDPDGLTVWAIFKKDTDYFKPSTQPFLLNFRVENLDELLEALLAEGVWIDPKREDYDYGRFAWIMDPEGNRVELWEPPRHS